MFSNDAQHASKRSEALVNCLCQVKWQVDAGTILKAPVAAAGLVIAASLDHGSTRNYGFLRAFNDETGAPRWQFAGKDATGVVGGITTTPVVAGGLVLFGSGRGSCNAVELTSGRLAWEFDTGGDILARPALRDGTAYFGSADGSAYALDVRSGTCLWKFTAQARIYAPLAVNETTVYLADADGGLYALTLDGDLRWRAELPYMRPVSTVLAGNFLIISDLSGGTLCAFDLTMRRQVWSLQLETASPIIPAVSSGIVCISGRGSLAGLDLISGEKLWALPIGGDPGPPVVAGRTVVIARRDGRIYGVNIAQGTERWTCEAGQSVVSEMLIDESALYFGSAARELVAVRLLGIGSREFARERAGCEMLP